MKIRKIGVRHYDSEINISETIEADPSTSLKQIVSDTGLNRETALIKHKNRPYKQKFPRRI